MAQSRELCLRAAVVNYTILGKLVRAADTKIWLAPTKVAKAFLISDVVCFFFQAAGGGQMVSTSKTMAQAGQAMVLFGLILQLVFFSVFLAMSVKAYSLKGLNPRTSGQPRMLRVWGLLWGTMALLYIRNIYRVVEFAQLSDATAYVTVNEWLFYVFESIPIFLCCVAYCIWHPGVLLDSDESLAAAVKSTTFGAMATAGAAYSSTEPIEKGNNKHPEINEIRV
jgi:hypothetical protein